MLHVLYEYSGRVLTDNIATEVCGELVRYGLYRPTIGVTKDIEQRWGGKRITDKSQIGLRVLSNQQVKELQIKNPQRHGEAGFAYGWPSRFATIFDFAKELGFVYYWPGEPIKFSAVGRKLAESMELKMDGDNIILADTHPEYEEQAFLNALTKYQRDNPFVRVANENAPLILLLQVIEKLNQDSNFSGSGISKLELPLLIYWKDGDSEKLYKRIKKLRKDHGYTPSWEVIVDICRNEIMKGSDIVRKPRSIVIEYPDEFIRKMRLTGLISLRGGGRFIDINEKRRSTVDYIFKKYSRYRTFESEQAYFEYVSTADPKLMSEKPVIGSAEEQEKYLDKWLEAYSWQDIKTELSNLSTKKLTADGILKYLSAPVRLEFLTALAVKSRFPNLRVVPNYPVDDEGLPTSTAGGIGDKGDIECYENGNGILVEVTMSEGRSQTVMEVWPIARHLENFSKNLTNSICYFVAPSIFIDSERQINFLSQKDQLHIIPLSISNFVNHIEKNKTLYSTS